MAKRGLHTQAGLFDVPPEVPAPADPARPVAGPRPWDPVDAADVQLGWAHRWVTPARAREIRAQRSARHPG